MRLIQYNLLVLGLYPKVNNQGLVWDLSILVFLLMVSDCLLRQVQVFLYEPNALIQEHHNKSRAVKPDSLYQVVGSSFTISGFLSYNCGLNLDHVSHAFSISSSFPFSLSSDAFVIGL